MGSHYMKFINILTPVANKDKKNPLIMLTDVHSSRFNLYLMRFCQMEGLRQYMGPPDSTHVTQLLDQINAALHMSYRKSSMIMIQLIDMDFLIYLQVSGRNWRLKNP